MSIYDQVHIQAPRSTTQVDTQSRPIAPEGLCRPDASDNPDGTTTLLVSARSPKLL
jgi:hypothetical protein